MKTNFTFKLVRGALMALALLFVTTSYADNNMLTDPSKSIIVSRNNPTFSIKLNSSPKGGALWLLKEIDTNLITPLRVVYHHNVSKKGNKTGYEEWFFHVNAHAFQVPRITGITMLSAQPDNMQNVQGSGFRVIISTANNAEEEDN